jgi:hypothetical protein
VHPGGVVAPKFWTQVVNYNLQHILTDQRTQKRRKPCRLSNSHSQPTAQTHHKDILPRGDHPSTNQCSDRSPLHGLRREWLDRAMTRPTHPLSLWSATAFVSECRICSVCALPGSASAQLNEARLLSPAIPGLVSF